MESKSRVTPDDTSYPSGSKYAFTMRQSLGVVHQEQSCADAGKLRWETVHDHTIPVMKDGCLGFLPYPGGVSAFAPGSSRRPGGKYPGTRGTFKRPETLWRHALKSDQSVNRPATFVPCLRGSRDRGPDRLRPVLTITAISSWSPAASRTLALLRGSAARWRVCHCKSRVGGIFG